MANYRMFAAIAALLVMASAAGVTAESASATPAPPSSNQYADIAIGASATAVAVGDSITFTTTITPHTSSLCTGGNSGFSFLYKDHQTSWFQQSSVESGGSTIFTTNTGPLVAGTYIFGASDEGGCATEDGTSHIIDLEASIAVQVGPVGVVDWPAPAVDSMTAGVAFDQTFVAPSTGDWNWGGGGTVLATGLPAGLTSELVNPSVPGVAATIRIFGTPTASGPFDISLIASDALPDTATTHLIGTVAVPLRVSNLALDIPEGADITGANVVLTGSGLQSGSDYTLVVRSSPQTIAQGAIDASLALATAGAIPAGLETGWHSATFSGTWFDGAPASSTLWFRIDAGGLLIATSATTPLPDPVAATPAAAPRLAATGASDESGTLTLAIALSLLGLVLVLSRRKQSLHL